MTWRHEQDENRHLEHTFLHTCLFFPPYFLTLCMHVRASSYYLQYCCFTFTHHATSHILEVCFVGLSYNGLIPARTSWQLICGGLVFFFFPWLFSVVSPWKRMKAFPTLRKRSVPRILELIKSPSCGKKKKKSTHFQLIKLPSNTWYAMNLGALVHLRGPGAPGCTWLAGKENKSRMKQGWTAYVCFY